MRVLVVGMGKSGLAAARLLVREGAHVTATDSKPLSELGIGEEIERLGIAFRAQSDEAFQDQDLIVLSPGVPVDLPPLPELARRGVPAIGEVELASWFLKGPVIGITGSNGKTTTTALTGHILTHAGIPVQVGGNIGTPLAAIVDSSRYGQWNVLELSSFQLETIDTFRVRTAALLNITPNHLNRHRTMEAYTAAKARIFENQRDDDFAVLNADNAGSAAFAGRTRGRTLWFSTQRSVNDDGDGGAWLDRDRLLFGGEAFLHVRDVRLQGRHNIENILAAAAMSRTAGASLPQIGEGISTFSAVEHRLEYVDTIAGVRYFNDSKATSVDAAMKALEALEAPLWVILGGEDKGSDYRLLREPLRQKAHGAVLIGSAAPKIREHLAGALELIDAGTLDTAVRRVFERAASGDTVLLAPACASYDQFENFEHRGRVFKELVAQLRGDA